MSPPTISIPSHTTASSPRPHILYSIHVSDGDTEDIVRRRYSEFSALKVALGDDLLLPPKRILSTTFIPSAWLDDALISERKAGLAAYLTSVLSAYPDHEAVKSFLAGDSGPNANRFNPEDAVPSTLSRKAAVGLAEHLADEESGEVEAAAPVMKYASYYPDWVESVMTPEAVMFGKFDIIFFAFAMPNSSSTLDWGSDGQSLLRRLVSASKSAGFGTKIVLSIGGWTGCYWYSQACSTSSNRSKFVSAIVSAVNTFGLAGVDLDWEYPNSAGAGNPHSSSDAANLLSLIKSLRSALGSSAIISAAVPHLPWLGSNGSPLTNVSAYAAQMTYVNIMNYDVWGSSSNPGPNAPYGNLCGTSTQPQASAQAALKQWTAAGFPASKLLLGLPLYGYVSQSTRTSLTGSRTSVPEDGPTLPEGDDVLKGALPHPRDADVYNKQRVEANLQGWYGQQIPFSNIVSGGALVKKSNGSYGEAGGFTMAWDDCSNTPFLFNKSQSTVVTYDDTYSLADKAKFAKDSGMAGAFTWSLEQSDGKTLHDAIRTALGRPLPT